MTWLTLARRIGGAVLFTAGAFSLVLPIVPGWLLIALGLYLLSIDSPGLQRRFSALCARFPLLERLRRAYHRFLGHTPDGDRG